MQLEAGEVGPRHRHGVGHQHHPLGAFGGNGDAQGRIAHVMPIDDEAAPRVPAVERSAHGARIASGHAAASR